MTTGINEGRGHIFYCAAAEKKGTCCHADEISVRISAGDSAFSPPALAQVRITEFMASNTQTLMDEDGDSSDWIELQNTSGNGVNLLNWALTDSASHPAKWLFPATNIPPGEFHDCFRLGQKPRGRRDRNCTRISNFPPTANISR